MEEIKNEEIASRSTEERETVETAERQPHTSDAGAGTNTRASHRKVKKRQPLSFGGTMLASALGVIIATAVVNIIAVIFGLIMLAGILSTTEPTTVVGDDIAVCIDLTQTMMEGEQDELQGYLDNGKTVNLHDVLKAVERAADDKRVKALYIYAGEGGEVSWAQSVELRQAVEAFKQSGKPVVAYGNSYSQPAYYLASVADTVVLNPAGMVDFRGLAAESIFIKEMLDKLGVNVDLIRPNSNVYKSAGETYTMTHYSDANREQVRSYLSSIWNYVVEGIGEQRGIPTERLNSVADNLEGVLAHEAKDAGLVDSLGFEESVRNMLKKAIGAKRVYDAVRYNKSFTPAVEDGKIAVIYAEGNVQSGSSKGMDNGIYANDIVKALDDAAKNDKVKTIVLRINSPGGSAIASESITDAVVRAKEKKPLIVSMGSMAASAGYEMASGATKIVALPVTLTGSIGVFGVVPEFGTLLRSRLGITTDTVATNANASGLGIFRPMSPTSRAMMQRNVESFYVNFCMRVATGRGLEVEYVDSIARGRVWTGAEAQKIGLVDELGGMERAMALAAEEAGMKTYSVVVYPSKKDLMTQIMDFAGSSREVELSAQMRSRVPFATDLLYWTEMEPLQARLPFVVNID